MDHHSVTFPSFLRGFEWQLVSKNRVVFLNLLPRRPVLSVFFCLESLSRDISTLVPFYTGTFLISKMATMAKQQSTRAWECPRTRISFQRRMKAKRISHAVRRMKSPRMRSHFPFPYKVVHSAAQLRSEAAWKLHHARCIPRALRQVFFRVFARLPLIQSKYIRQVRTAVSQSIFADLFRGDWLRCYAWLVYYRCKRRKKKI